MLDFTRVLPGSSTKRGVVFYRGRLELQLHRCSEFSIVHRTVFIDRLLDGFKIVILFSRDC